jgi:hypothetical protein
MDNLFLSYLSTLGGQAPILLAYLVGAILALVFWGRYPGPALLTFLACLLLFLLSLGQSFVSTWLIHSRDMREADRGTMFAILAITSNVLRAGAFAMLLIAVFVGRARRPEHPA